MKPLIAGNWKLHGTVSMAVDLLKKLKELVKDVKDVDILVCPPFTALRDVEGIIRGSNIMLGSQNVFYEEKGAFTGEISPLMLKELKCTFAIVGHSERRQYFMETDLAVNKKIKACLEHNLTPIMCVGETQQERGDDITKKVIEKQVTKGLNRVAKEEISRVIIAYEPIWAIGTGQTATPEQAQEIHYFIRDVLRKLFGEEEEKVRILYGGSVKPENIKSFMAKRDIHGALVGGASLKADSFAGIVKASLNNSKGAVK